MTDNQRSTNGFSLEQAQLQSLAEHVLLQARAQGATSCDVDISEGFGQSVSIRMGEVETIEYNRDKGVAITIYIGQSKGHASSADLSGTALAQTVSAAVAIARHTAADACAGLPDASLMASEFRDLDLYHAWQPSVEDAIELALSCESAARSVDARITNSEGANVSSHAGQSVFANSSGFMGYQRSTRHTVSCTVIAQAGEAMQRDYWYSTARHRDDLEDVVSVGQTAGQRALARLGAKRIATGEYPVLLDPAMSAGLFGHFVGAVSGGSLYRQSSFLPDSIGTAVFSPIVQIFEDPFVMRGFGSACYDAEGVATRARDLVIDGVLQGYFLATYSSRKLGMQSTGNAGGNHNLLIRPTGGDLADMLKRLGTGLYVTEMLGQGINPVTGDYSRGAAGFWVENGQIVHPVEEITIAGNLRDMYKNIVAIGSDIETRGSKQVGSVLLERMSVAGL